MSKKKKAASDEEILKIARKRYAEARKADKEERRLADEDTRFAVDYNGCQWPTKVREIREGAKPPRPCLVMNKIPEKIDQADGEFRKLRPTIKVKPVDSQADPKIAEILCGLIRHIEYASNGRAAYTTAHSSVLHGGRGAWRINIVDNMDDPFEQEIQIGRIPNALSVTWDPHAKKVDRSDGRYFFIEELVPEDEFKDEINAADWPVEDGMEFWRTDDSVLVAEYWWVEMVNKTFYRVNRNGTEMTVTELGEGEKSLKDKIAEVPKLKWCKMIANKIIEGPFEDWPGRLLPLILELGKEVNIGGRSKTRGMVRFGKEPQRMYNYFTSSEAEQIALAPKAPYLVTPKMIKDHEPQWDSMNTANYAYLLFNADSNAPGLGPKREAPPLLSQAMVVAKQGMEHDIMSAMNVYSASLGEQGSEVSGKAIDSRVRQGSIGSYGYTDNFENALLYSAKVLVELILVVYTSEQVVRILGENDEEKLVAINARPDSDLLKDPRIDQDLQVSSTYSKYINDFSVGKYDVVATIGPAYTTQREEALDKLIRIIELMPKVADVAPDLIIGLMDMPMSDELLKRLKKTVPEGIRELDQDEEPPPEQPPSTEEMIKMKEVELKFQEQQRKDFEAGVNSILTIAKAEAEEEGMQMPTYVSQVEALLQRFTQPQQTQVSGQPGPVQAQ